MIIHFKKRPRPTVQAPLTSLIDIVFMLLIYFLLTTNFIVDEGITVKLPEADASSPQTSQQLVVFVDADGRTWIDDQQVSESRLFAELKERLADKRDRRVIVRADRRLMLNKAVRVMDMAKAAGAKNLTLATEKRGEGLR